ncbi:MAG: hypothetical protein KKB20_17810 [Proteobacteria bacterium]|nr:hypothetical protein [Pseudomonadota bacterium]
MDLTANLLVSFFGGAVSVLTLGSLSLLIGLAAFLRVTFGWSYLGTEAPPPGEWVRIGRLVFFLGGFGGLFVIQGLPATGPGGWTWANEAVIRTICGGLTVFLGLLAVGWPRALAVRKTGRRAPRAAIHLGWALAVGLAFAAGWTPRPGLILSSIVILGGAEGYFPQGLLYLSAYTAGFIMPFFLVGLGLDLFMAFPARRVGYERGSSAWAVVLIAVGVAILFNVFDLLPDLTWRRFYV